MNRTTNFSLGISLQHSSFVQISSLRIALWDYVTGRLRQNIDLGPNYLRNKYAQSLVAMMVREYLNVWPSFVDDLLCWLSFANGFAIDAFLRVCSTLHEEIGLVVMNRSAEQLARNVAIKDAMRVSDISRLCRAWMTLLSSSQPVETSKTILTIISNYAAWIDVNLVAEQSFVGQLYNYLNMDELQLEACNCLTEIVAKGMLPSDKLKLVKYLNIQQIFASIGANTDGELFGHACRLLSVTGLEISAAIEGLPSNDALRAELVEYNFELATHLVRFMWSSSIESTSALAAFALAFVSAIKSTKPTLSPRQKKLLIDLLSGIITRSRYSADFDFEAPDEEEESFLELRRALDVGFDQIVQLLPVESLQVVSSLAIPIFKRPEQQPDFTMLELALYLLFRIPEATKTQPPLIVDDAKVSDGQLYTKVGEMFLELTSSNILEITSHPLVMRHYFEIVARYAGNASIVPMLESKISKDETLLMRMIRAFVQKGLVAEEESLWPKVWHLFGRFIKALKSKISPAALHTLQSISGLLVLEDKRSKSDANFEHRASLFETAGMLVGLCEVSEEQYPQVLQVASANASSTLSRILDKASTGQSLTKEDVQLGNNGLLALGSIAKGYSDINRSLRPSMSDAFAFHLRLVERVLSIMSANYAPSLFAATVFACQRFSNLPSLDVSNMLFFLLQYGCDSTSTVNDMLALIPLISAAFFKMKGAAIPLLSPFWPVLVSKIDFLLSQPPTGTDDLFALVELRKAYLAMIVAAFAAGVAGELARGKEGVSMLIKSVLDCAMATEDLHVWRAFLGVLIRIAQQWCLPSVALSNAAVDTAVAELYEKGLPTAFAMLSHPDLHVAHGSDAQAFLQDLAFLQKSLVKARPAEEAYPYLRRIVESRMSGIKEEELGAYLRALASLDGKELKNCFVQFVENWRRRIGL